jgi:hypothetical protein
MHRLIAVLAVALSLATSSPTMAAPAPPRTILFVGNSFTQGSLSSVLRYRAATVTDLNGSGFGGVPALFKTFTEQVGRAYTVSLETQGGRPLSFHWNERRALLDRAWDVVVMQEYSTLDPAAPGDATEYRTFAPLLAAMFTKANPKVDVELMATWTRADLTYPPGRPWSGRPVAEMALDVRKAADGVKALSKDIDGVAPVGQAWNRAIATGIADANPYDGIAPSQLNLWAIDNYHASDLGYYLEALVVFGKVTGVDPRTLGARERAAAELGIAPATAVALQKVAFDELAALSPKRR